MNLFIADDVGLGKTIEAGLIVRELLMRQRVRRIVVAAPPSVVLQWKEELSKKDLSAFPDVVKARVGGALWDAQRGFKANSAKPLRGFPGAGVLEVVADFDGDTFRTVYTVRFEQAIFVLHAFQKKSKHGIATSKAELGLIKPRLARAREDYGQWLKNQQFQ